MRRPIHPHLPSYGHMGWDRIVILIQAGHFAVHMWGVPVRHFAWLQNSSAPCRGLTRGPDRYRMAEILGNPREVPVRFLAFLWCGVHTTPTP